jgi:hypothetical protein
MFEKVVPYKIIAGLKKGPPYNKNDTSRKKDKVQTLQLTL